MCTVTHVMRGRRALRSQGDGALGLGQLLLAFGPQSFTLLLRNLQELGGADGRGLQNVLGNWNSKIVSFYFDTRNLEICA